MNTQKYLISSVAAAVFMFFYGFVVYAILLADYVASIAVPGTMVPEGEENIMMIAIGTLIQALALGLLYTKGHEGKGAMEGVRFGLFIGIFITGIYVLMTGIGPYILMDQFTFAAIDTVMYMGAGVVFAMLYKK